LKITAYEIGLLECVFVLFVLKLGNMSGNDKAPHSERVSWSEKNADKVKQVATDPLADRWWLKLENPWQFLSACCELQAALDSGDPSTYVSHLPVYQDGSCNGLQHYAALARDSWGGSSVNLCRNPQIDRPMDVYSDVAALVLKRVEEDAAKGLAIAHVVIPHIVRKVIKQTVMTSVYGVTIVGAREQILRQLLDRGMNDKEGQEAAMYLAKHTMGAMRTMFTNARLVMDFLTECAHIVAKLNQPMTWVSPLGIPIVQPYRRNHKHVVSTHMQRITLCEFSDLLPISPARQKAAFPPNFVHSLDASHMMMTALECFDQGITFSAVHDSFWTHARHVDTMNVLLREQFVALYEQPILHRFRESLVTRYSASLPSCTPEFPPVPPQGDFDIKKVLDAPYFFS
jgi:DNA-directed RNA polymerase